jgi:dTDP-4-dehydrorhamnose reductase
MTRWLITGANGMLGTDLIALLTTADESVTPLGRGALDITDAAAAKEVVALARPDVVVNCAAWTAVDDAEAHEDEALAVNGHAVANLATACANVGAALVHVSTDYVFDGTATLPYREDATPAPRTAYGRTKLAGERAALTILPDAGYVMRTAWLYGAHGSNFVRTMLRLAYAGISPTVVDDQRGQPTWSLDVARQIRSLIRVGAPPGIYHATSSGETTWHGLAGEVFKLFAAAQVAPDLGEHLSPIPTTSAAYQRPAPRPPYSVLGHAAWTATGIPPIPDWRESLHRAFPALLASGRPCVLPSETVGRAGPTKAGVPVAAWEWLFTEPGRKLAHARHQWQSRAARCARAASTMRSAVPGRPFQCVCR